MSTQKPNFPLTAATLAAMLALSCNMNTSAGTTTSENTAPAAVPNVAAAPAKVELSATDTESGAPLSAEVVAKTNALAARLGTAIGQDQGVRIAFVSCEQAPCSARLSGSSLAALQQAVGDVERDQGQVTTTTRERLDPYQGRSFEADITLGPDAAP